MSDPLLDDINRELEHMRTASAQLQHLSSAGLQWLQAHVAIELRKRRAQDLQQNTRSL
jgi:hypothetical protein